MQEGMRLMEVGSWKATSALAKGKYRLSSSGGIPRTRVQEELLHSQRHRVRARRAVEKKQVYVCYIWNV